MRETTIKKYKRIYKRYKELLGSNTVMNIYYQLADEFAMSIERIRQIIKICRHDWWNSLAKTRKTCISLHRFLIISSYGIL